MTRKTAASKSDRRCKTCRTDIDAVIASGKGGAVSAHWATATSAKIVGWTCSERCADAYDARRFAAN